MIRLLFKSKFGYVSSKDYLNRINRMGDLNIIY